MSHPWPDKLPDGALQLVWELFRGTVDASQKEDIAWTVYQVAGFAMGKVFGTSPPVVFRAEKLSGDSGLAQVKEAFRAAGANVDGDHEAMKASEPVEAGGAAWAVILQIAIRLLDRYVK